MRTKQQRVLEFMRYTKDLIEALTVLAIGLWVAYKLYEVQ